MVAQSEFQKILQTVANWSKDDRDKLIDAIAHGSFQSPPLPRPKMSDLLGIARGDGPPPTDEQVKQWIHEHRMEKYGK